MITLRNATISDAPAIAKIHVSGWLAAYRGLIPDTVLDNLSVSERRGLWQNHLTATTGRTIVLCDTGEVVGFAHFGPSAEDSEHDAWELFSIYLLQNYWGKGLGGKLMQAVLNRLDSQAAPCLIAWVLVDDMRARHFYERMGFMLDSIEPLPAQWPGVSQVRYRKSPKP